MNFYIGIDGGGTKTAFSLADEEGTIVKRIRKEGTSYKHAGMDTVLSRVKKGTEELLEGVPYQKENVFICFGAPNYGESTQGDELLASGLQEVLSGYQLLIVNDCQVGWAGSLGLAPGINIVAGTGAIGFGKDSFGSIATAGGWSDFFSDEGSCRWLGVKTMELFGKQADGRTKRGALYKEVMQHFKVENPIDVIDIFEADYQPYREKLASLQLVLREAAKQNDQSALLLYEQAAHELSLVIIALYQKLQFKEWCKVSYSGGLFKNKDLILKPLKEKLSGYKMDLVKPIYEPVEGAVLLAGEMAGKVLVIK